MKHLLASFALLVSSGLTAAPTTAPVGDKPITVTLTDPARPATLHVSLIHGSISVKGTNRKDMLITVREGADEEEDEPAEKPKAAGGLREISQPLGYTIEEGNNEVDVSSDSMSRAVDVIVEVPAKTNLNLSTVNNGAIKVEGVDGELELANVNDEILLDKVSGSVVAHTTNGAVKATILRVTPGKPMAFTTLNGDVDIMLPASTKATLRLRSDNGQLFTDFDFTAQPAEVQETRESSGRTLREIGKFIGGAINGGGPVFELRSFNGDVYVRRAGT